MNRILPTLALALATTTAAAAQSITVAEGPGPNQLAITTYKSGSVPVAAPVSGLEILPLELAGRTERDSLDATRPQLAADPPRLVLPSGAIVVAYRRSAGSIYGYLAISRTGESRVLLEQPALAGASPFLPTVGAAPSGSHLALATTPAAGGDLWLAPVAAGAAANLTPGAPIAFDDTSLTFANQALFATAGEAAVYRAPLPAGPAQSLVLPPSAGAAPAYVSPEIAVSRDGSTIAFLAGLEKKKTDLYVGDAAGLVWNRTQSQARHEAPGYLPDEILGPNLALSEDGSRVAYLRRLDESELFVADTAPSAAGLGTQLTSNAQFQESIGTGITLGFRRSAVGFGFGGVTATFDFFQASTATAPVLTNLTLTGSTAMPFQDIATIVPAHAWRLPGSGALLVVDGGAAPGLRVADPANPNNTVVAAAPALLGPAARAGRVPFVAPAAGGAALYVAKGASSGAGVQLVHALGSQGTATRLAASPSSSYAAIALAGNGAEVRLVNLAMGGYSTRRYPGAQVTGLALDGLGHAKVAIAAGSLAHAEVLAPSGAVLLSTAPAATVFVLR